MVTLLLVSNADGRLEVFLVGQNNQLYHRYQTAPNNDWNSEWLSLGGKWDKNKIPALANNADGRLEVFLVGQNNRFITGIKLHQTMTGTLSGYLWVESGMVTLL